MKVLLTLSLLFFSIVTMANDREVQDVLSLSLRADGNFDVICLDGVSEVRTSRDIQNNNVCTHFINIDHDFTLTHGGAIGGSRFCDMRVNAKISYGVLRSVAIDYLAPCSETAFFHCDGVGGCYGQSAGDYISINYVDGLFIYTNENYGVTGYFENPTLAKDYYFTLQDLDGESNVLQAYDNSNLRPMCVPTLRDNGYDYVENAAIVYCSQNNMELDSFQRIPYTGVYPLLDARECQGYESSLNDCFYQVPCMSNEVLQVSCRPKK
jgi:hypothetical protein